MRGILAAGVAALALFLAVPAHADGNDDAFLTVIDNAGISIPHTLNQARAVCMVFDRTDETFVDAVNGVVGYNSQQGAPISASDAAFFAGAAVQAYCPQYKALVKHTGGA
jgi:Ethanolamine utilization protein EutJ (predicted chaperonin)